MPEIGRTQNVTLRRERSGEKWRGAEDGTAAKVTSHTNRRTRYKSPPPLDPEGVRWCLLKIVTKWM